MTKTCEQSRAIRLMSCSMIRNATPWRLSSATREMIVSQRLGLTPAAGSSSSTIAGSAIMARASSRSFRCPPERMRAGSCASPSSVTNSRSAMARSTLARSSRATSRARNQFAKIRSPTWFFAATSRFSISVICGKGRGIWNVRPSPRLRRVCAGSRSIAAPSSRIVPPVGRTVPAMQLKSVVLPAPFGPISPTISPRRTAIETESTAATPPNRRETARTSSIV